MTTPGRAIEFRGASNPTRADAPPPAKGRGYLALPPAGSGPGVLLLHAWWGLNETFRGVADRLAQERFIVLAADLFGDGHAVTTVAEASERMDDLDDMRAEQVALGAIDRLFAEPGLVGDRLGVLGFSMGANFGMWAALKRQDQVAANVLMYGSGAPGAGRSRVQGHFAPADLAWSRMVPFLHEVLARDAAESAR